MISSKIICEWCKNNRDSGVQKKSNFPAKISIVLAKIISSHIYLTGADPFPLECANLRAKDSYVFIIFLTRFIINNWHRKFSQVLRQPTVSASSAPPANNGAFSNSCVVSCQGKWLNMRKHQVNFLSKLEASKYQ